MNQTVATPAYAEYEFMNKAMNRINELIALCNQVEGERDQLVEKVAELEHRLNASIEREAEGMTSIVHLTNAIRYLELGVIGEVIGDEEFWRGKIDAALAKVP